MINPLNPTVMPVAPRPPARDRNPPSEDFGALLNSNQPAERTPPASHGAGNSDTQSKNGQTDHRSPEHNEQTLLSDAGNASTVSANGLEAQSLLTPQTLLMPTVASTKSDATTLSIEMSSLAEAAAKTHTITGASVDRIEIVSLPWHLQANGGLSYLSKGTAAQDLMPEQPTLGDATVPSNSSSGDAMLAGDLDARFAEEQAAYLQGGAIGFVSERIQHPTAMSASAEIAMPGRTAAASMLWPHRLLRWLADHDGRVSAWVRDYRLDPSEAGQLVDYLRNLAEQQGHSLHRIMLNGHELWRVPSTPDSH